MYESVPAWGLCCGAKCLPIEGEKVLFDILFVDDRVPKNVFWRRIPNDLVNLIGETGVGRLVGSGNVDFCYGGELGRFDYFAQKSEEPLTSFALESSLN